MSENLEEVLINSYKNDGLPLLKDIKSAAKVDFLEKGLPKVREEEYKFTPITKTLKKQFAFDAKPATAHVNLGDIEQQFIDSDSSNRLVFVNGLFSNELSVIDAQDGLVVKNFATAALENNDTILEYFGKIADTDSFSSLNTVLTQDGVFVEVSKNADAEIPLYVYHVNVAKEIEVFSTPRNLVVAHQGSRVRLIEKNITLGAHNSFSNSVTEVFVKENATVHHVKVQNDVANSYEVVQTKVHQESNSNYSAYTISLSGGMIRNNLNITSDGQNCESNMYGLYLLTDKTHVDNHTSVDHREPNSYSNELYKGVMDGHSKGVFNGKIYVRQEAQKTNAFQSNNNVLLSDTATLNTKPQLEIWADDVKCSHGCTSGQLDEEAIFYLQARGISKENAIGMLLYAFANDIVEKVPVAEVRTYLDLQVADRLKS